MAKQELNFDVVVIGSGVAGLSAAVAAQEHGARVTMPLLLLRLLVVVLLLAALVMMVGPGHEELVGLD